MSFNRLFSGLLLAVALCAGQPALAAAAADKPETNLYQEAMQLIAEGRYALARETLQRLVSDEPEHAGAWLDIAMLHCSMGNTAEAETLFNAIEQRFSPPPAILEVIAQQRARGCKGEQPETYARLRLGRGVDSNANQGARNPNFTIGSGNTLTNLVLSPEYAPRKDSFTALSGEISTVLSSAGTLGLLQFQTRQYDALSQYNLGLLVAGVEHPWRLGGWGLRGTGSLGLITLDNALYQRQTQLQRYVTPPLALPKAWEFGVIGGWINLTYPSLDGFDSQLWESRGLLTYRTEDALVQGSVGYAVDRGTNERPGSDRSGLVSGLSARLRLSGEVFGELGWIRQSWLGKQAYSPGLIDQKREQATRLLRAAVIFPVTREHAVHLEFRDVRNRENISIFEYEGRVLQLSWQWQTGR